MMTPINAVKSKCRNCDQEFPADQFKLHYQLKMMVCPNCFSGKKKKEEEKVSAPKQEEAPKSPGWDKDDEYLEKYHKIKLMDAKPVFQKMLGSQILKCTCVHCKYPFKYDPIRKMPNACPYCNGDIPRVTNYNSA